MISIQNSSLRIALIYVCFIFSLASRTSADVRLPNVLSSDMVLQRNLPVPVWGWADPGENVSVTFWSQKKETTTDSKGNWMVTLDPISASSKPTNLTIQGKNKVTLTNILVGEVWICSGQSNMEWRLTQIMNSKQEIESANFPKIRLFNVPGHTVSPVPKREGKGKWEVCTPKSVAGFSAVGFFFGRRLYQELNMPIGLIGSNWGGTRIEPWTTLKGFESVPELARYVEQVKAYTPKTRVNGGDPSAIYNSMVHHLTPFAMRGAIWYQGESNGNEGVTYLQKKKALVSGWRQSFQNPDLAFYWVQLANFRGENPNPMGGDGWAKLREAQTQALSIPGTGMAVITDIGDARDIHPRNKQDVGWRLAQWALHQTYKKKELVPSGPLYKSHKVEGDKIRIHFKYAGSGLMVGKKEGLEPTQEVEDGVLQHFAIADQAMKWHWAEARIDGNTVVVSSPKVKNPKDVRYAFSMNPAKANLYNREGLPAGAFRTDNWRGPSEDLKWIPFKGERPAKSTPGANSEINFTNKRDHNVKIYWISYGGPLKFYRELKPGESHQQNTFSKAYWLITDQNEKPLGYFKTTNKIGIAVIPKDG